RAVGFMSYRPQDVNADLGETVTAYVTTVIVEEEQRGRGITTAFYRALLARMGAGDTAATRTWSTNAGHIRILTKLGFTEAKRIAGGRGPGIDTVYYRKQVEGADGA